jgi:hypothetical protein
VSALYKIFSSLTLILFGVLFARVLDFDFFAAGLAFGLLGDFF